LVPCFDKLLFQKPFHKNSPFFVYTISEEKFLAPEILFEESEKEKKKGLVEEIV